MKERKKRFQSLGEEIGNSITHGVGWLLAIAGLVLLIVKADTGYELAGGIVFGCAMIFVYAASCLYHAFKQGSKVKNLFRIFDHSAIFILIAGTYTPILLCLLGGWVGWLYFAIQWAIVVIAILLRIFKPGKNTILQVILCLVLGWSGISIIPQMYNFSPMFLWLILGGGAMYSLGICFYGSRFKYAHFVWHFFVIFGTICHFLAIYLLLF